MAATELQETTVSAGGLRVFVREQGEGHPLLLLNGIGANVDMWGPAESILAAGSRTIAIDLPGTGRSDTPLFPLPMPTLSRVVLAALDALGHERVDVMGFSFGGALAQQLALDAPDRVRRLALVSTACGWGGTPGAATAVAAVSNPLRHYSRSWYELTNRLLGERGGDAAHASGRFSHAPTPLGYAYQVWALATWSSRAWLHRVAAPTLVVSGGSDRLIPVENAAQLARLLPQSRLHLLPTAAHLLMFYRGGAAPRLLADFFASRSLEDSEAWANGIDLRDAPLLRAAA